jgi:hypothetical protein
LDEKFGLDVTVIDSAAPTPSNDASLNRQGCKAEVGFQDLSIDEFLLELIRTSRFEFDCINCNDILLSLRIVYLILNVSEPFESGGISIAFVIEVPLEANEGKSLVVLHLLAEKRCRV